jgi:hydrogenase maturation protease
MRSAQAKPLVAKTLIIGLGNPILGDDSVGWRVIQEFSARFLQLTNIPLSSIEVDCLSLGGLSLMERMIGYERVILVDTIFTGQKPPGTVSCFPIAALPDFSSGHTSSAHDTSLQNALRVGRTMGYDLPQSIEVVSVEAEPFYEFSEELTPPVAAAVPEAVQAILDLVMKIACLAEKEQIQ